MSNRAKTILLLLVDTLILFLAMGIIVLIRKNGNPSVAYLERHINLFSVLFPFWILMYFIEGLYTLKTYNPANLPISIIRGTLLSVIVSFLVIYLMPGKVGVTPKTNLVLIAIASLPLMFFWRRFFFTYFGAASRQRNTIIIGSQDTISLVEEEIKRKPHLGYKISSSYTSDLSTVPDMSGVELVAIERNVTKNAELYKEVFAMLGSGIEIIDLAKFAESISGKIPIRAIDESWFIEYCGHQESRTYDVLKNIIDRTVAILMLIMLVTPSDRIVPLLVFYLFGFTNEVGENL
jgi:hypothetical protein